MRKKDLSGEGEALARFLTTRHRGRRQELIIVPVDFLPRGGQHWLLYDSGALAVSLELWESGHGEQALRGIGVPFRGMRRGERLTLRGAVKRVTCPLCGRDDEPAPAGKRPTVNDLGLLRSRR